MGTRIKDAVLVGGVSEGYKIPISDGSNQPKTASVGQISEFVNQKYGVEQKLSELGSKIDIIKPEYINSYNKIDPNRLHLGKGIGANGEDITQSNYFNTDFIDVLGKDMVYTMIYANGYLYAYDESLNFLEKPNPDTTNRRYILPTGTRYIRLAGAQSLIGGEYLYLYLENNKNYYEYGITKDKVNIETNREELLYITEGFSSARRTDTTSINKINVDTDFIDGYIIDSNGEIVSSTAGCISCFIDVHWLDKIFCSAYAQGSVHAYSGNLVWLKVLPPKGGGYNGAYLIEDDVKYVRITINDKTYKNKMFLYTDEVFVTNKSQLYNSVNYNYGVTKKDLEYDKVLETVPTKVDEYDPLYINSINFFTTEFVEKENAIIQDDGTTIVSSELTKGRSYTKYIKVISRKYLSTNMRDQGYAFSYDKDKKYLGSIRTQNDSRFRNDMGYFVIPESVEYIRFNMNMSFYYKYFLAVGNDIVYDNKYKLGETFDIHFKYRGKKLVTIGDSITYQKQWQDRLCELTGLVYEPREIRGDDESVRTEGHGYILLDDNLKDTDFYYDKIEGITKTSEDVVDEFGYHHPIWSDAEGNKYRQPCRTAEGGETVMPISSTSIYSRASDSKYYKGDVIIVFAGANDKIKYVDRYPTVGNLSTIKGITNLKNESEDVTDGEFEIYTENNILDVVGDYSDEGVTTGIKKYNYTFRGCYRGLLKKVVDANPTAQIIVIAPFATMLKGNTYISRIYDYIAKKENEVIKECARDFGCQCIDLYDIFGRYNAERFFSADDGSIYIHPTSEGGKKIGEYIAAMIM